MLSTLKERVQARLDALGINPFEAARRAGFERSFVNDLLIGKKGSIRPRALTRLAAALECDPDYLNGRSALPGAPVRAGAGHDGEPGARIRFGGVIEPGVWRAAIAAFPPRLPAEPDPRYSASDQVLYSVRGDDLADLGIHDGMVVQSVVPDAVDDGLSDGDALVIRRLRGGGESELSIRTLRLTTTGASLVSVAGQEPPLPYPLTDDDAAVEGIILRVIRIFGRLS